MQDFLIVIYFSIQTNKPKRLDSSTDTVQPVNVVTAAQLRKLSLDVKTKPLEGKQIVEPKLASYRKNLRELVKHKREQYAEGNIICFDYECWKSVALIMIINPLLLRTLSLISKRHLSLNKVK